MTHGGPAEKAGIKQGDVILKFDGKEIDEMRNLPRIVAETADRARRSMSSSSRQGEETTVEVVVGELTDEAEQASLPTSTSHRPIRRPGGRDRRSRPDGLGTLGRLRQKFTLTPTSRVSW